MQPCTKILASFGKPSFVAACSTQHSTCSSFHRFPRSPGHKGGSKVGMAVHEMVIFAAVVLSAVALVWVWTNNSAGSAHRHGRALLEDVHVKHQKLHDVHDPFHEKLIQYFPQARLCSRQWVKDYGKMHARIRAGLEDPYYFVSVAVAAGLADRIIGMVSQFYVGALLQQRAFVTHNWGLLPNFNSTCESPYFDWLTPLNLPDEVLESVKTSYKGLAKNEFGYGIFPNTVDTKEYNSQIWINCEVFKEDRCDAKGFHERNLTAMPKCNPKVPYIVSTSNRGYTYAIATNPYHRAQFYEYGVRPEEVRAAHGLAFSALVQQQCMHRMSSHFCAS